MKYIFSVFTLILFSLTSYCQDTLTVYFNHDSKTIGKINKARISNKLKNKSNLRIEEIIGYTSTPGTNNYNYILASKRIQSTLKYLQNTLSIDTSLIKKQVFGEVLVSSKQKSLDRKTVLVFSHNGDKKELKESIKSMKVGENLILENLNFQPGLDILLPESHVHLEELYNILSENEKIKIEIQGHICCEINDVDDLATDRAKTVYNYLLNKGIEKRRLSYKGFGATKPIYPLPELNEFQRVANRRVEIKIIEK